MGRPKKEIKPFAEAQREVLEKLLIPQAAEFWFEEFTQDETVKLLATHQIPDTLRLHPVLTLDEISYIMPFADGTLPTEKRRMSRMQIKNMEVMALGKLKKKLAANGIKSFSEVFGNREHFSNGTTVETGEEE